MRRKSASDLKRLKRESDLRHIVVATDDAEPSRDRGDTASHTTARQSSGKGISAGLPAQTLTAAIVSRRRWALPLAALVVLIAGGFGYFWKRPLPPPKVSNYVQLTHDGEPKNLEATDGSRLYFRLGTETSLRIAEASVSGGDPVPIPTPPRA